MHIHSGNVHEFAGRSVRVWLDGTEMDATLVTEADEERGYMVMAVSAKGGIIFVDPRTDNVREVKLVGRVDITLDGAELSKQEMMECNELFRRRTLKSA